MPLTSGDPTESRVLTALQKGMVLASMRSPRSGAYVLQDICELGEEIDAALLKRAWRQMSRRHAALRTRILADSGTWLSQQADENTEPDWRELDWSATPPEEWLHKLDEFLDGDRARGFDFDAGVPLRMALIRKAPHSCTLIWTVHHALLDGRSLLIVWREWFNAYESLRQGQEAAPRESEAVGERVERTEEQDLSRAEQYWRESLAGLTQTTEFVADRLRPASPQPQEGFRKEGVRLTKEATQELADFAREHGITVSTLVQGAWALLLNRYSGLTDVVFGTTRTGRSSPGRRGREEVGMLINTLPFRVAVEPETGVLPWLKQIREQWMAARDYEHAPLDKIRHWSGVAPGGPLFDSVVVYDHEPPEESLRKLGGGWEKRSFRRLQSTDSPLTLAAYGAPVLAMDIVYDTCLFAQETIARMAAHLGTILRRFPVEPDGRLADIKMLTEREEKWLVEDLNRTEEPREPGLCAHQLFERQAQRTPAQTAMEHPDGSVSYREMNRRANQLAALFRERSAGPDDLVAILLPASPEAVIAAMAVLKAGAAFLPLDPGLPAERLQRMLLDAKPKLVVTGAWPAGDPDGSGCEVLRLDRCRSEIERQSEEDMPNAAEESSAAYAIYTSGSTGPPKAVMVPHRALVNHTLAACRVYGITAADRRLQFASMGADVFVAEVFNYLCSGATLVFCPHRKTASVSDFLRLLEEHRITITGIPSPWWNEWVAAMSHGECAPPRTLRAVIAGMERVVPSALLAWRRATGNSVRWFNAYGPAETSPTATIYEAGTSAWEGEALVPIGRPIGNTRVYVLDEVGTPMPPGLPGELYIGGDSVARGYLHQPVLTAQRFLPDPFSGKPGSRLYRTGDRALVLPDGNLVLLGRADRQVKLRGFRIELDEIEAALALHPNVGHCAVALQGREGHEELVAYVTPDRGPAPAADTLRRHLARILPDPMIPAAFVLLAEMPRLPGGKIDRRSLPAYDFEKQQHAEQAFEEPSTETEKCLAAFWQEALGIARAGATDNFFELGGDSLAATRLITLIRERFDQEIPFAVLMRAPTVARLASILDGAAVDAAGAVIPLQTGGSLPPLFCITTTLNGHSCFKLLSTHLGAGQPFYVLPETVPDGPPPHNVDELAARVCEMIRGLRPSGPYLLAGYCLAGILAFEAARRLISAGEEVRLVALFDTPAPGYPKLAPQRTHYGRIVREVLFGGPNRPAGISFRDLVSHLAMIGRLAKRKALARYAPKPTPVSVVQFIAGEEPISVRVLEDPRLGWRDLTQGEFHVHHVRGAHGTLFQEPHVANMAALLNEALRRANTR